MLLLLLLVMLITLEMEKMSDERKQNPTGNPSPLTRKDFDSPEGYRSYINLIVKKHNEKKFIHNSLMDRLVGLVLQTLENPPKEKGENSSATKIPSVLDHVKGLGFVIPSNVEEKIKQLLTQMCYNLSIECLKLLVDTFLHFNVLHSRFHLESYGWHALACGLICAAKSVLIEGEWNVGFVLGFLHDVGKPFCETPKGFTFAHGQIGAQLVNGANMFKDINIELKEILLFIIDQHMCTCTHSVGDHKLCNETFAAMTKNYTVYQKEQLNIYWRALVIGDRVGKFCENPTTLEEAEAIACQIDNVFTAPTTAKSSGTIFIVMHGTPGTGKSTATQTFVKNLTSKGVNVGVAERDKEFYIAALKQGLNPNITFQQFVENKMDGKEETYYKHYYPLVREEITDMFTDTIRGLREKYNVIIIDSCISLNLQTMSKLFSSQDTVFVWNGFPQHMLGRGGSLKFGVGEQISYPLKNDYSFYRSILEGALPTQPFRPLVCSSRIAELCSLVDVFLANSSGSEAGKIIHPVTFLNGCDETGRRHTMEDLKSAQPYLLVEVLNIYKFLEIYGYKVIRLSYRDGTQHGNGVILSYRGEYIIHRMSDNTYHPLRVSLQVTPETRQMRKFNSHSSVYEYLTYLKQYIPGEFTSPNKFTTDTGAKCFVMPKPDGSLGVVFVVNKYSIQGEVLQLMKGKDISGNYLVEVDDYLVAFGSKGCLFLSQTREYEEEFAASINASYGSVDNLAHLVVSYLKENFTVTKTASVLFEMVPEHPHQGLTVDYGGNTFTTHLGTIIYDTEMKTSIKTILPDDDSKKFLQGVEVTEIPCTHKDIAAYYEFMMKEALVGRVMDLEGFMFAFRLSNGEILYVKVKFPWYFAAHKPDTNFEEAQKLATDPIYNIIRHRLVNLARSNCKLEARNDLAGTFRLFSQLLIEAFLKFIKNNDDITDRKSFILKFQQNKAAITTYSGIEDALSSALSKLDFKGKCNIESIVPCLWCNYEENRVNLCIDSITKYLIKNWRIKF
jgi:hypothetical protein